VTISDDSRDYAKFAERAMSNPEKGVPGLFPKVAPHWEGCIIEGGEYFEGDKDHSVAGMSKKIIKK
jgi:hypothetical protein